jgi:hypothetical protein
MTQIKVLIFGREGLDHIKDQILEGAGPGISVRRLPYPYLTEYFDNPQQRASLQCKFKGAQLER